MTEHVFEDDSNLLGIYFFFPNKAVFLSDSYAYSFNIRVAYSYFTWKLVLIFT